MAFFAFALIMVIICILAYVLIFERGYLWAGQSPGEEQRVDYGQKLREIVSNDPGIQGSFGDNYTVPMGIVNNDSSAVSFISYHGKIHHVDVDITDKKVTAIYEEHNETILKLINSTQVTMVANGTITSSK